MNNPYAPLKWISIVVVVVVAYMSWNRYQETRPVNELIPWRQDFDAARKESAATDKPVLLDFTATWCGPCQELKRTTWSQPAVANALKAYIPVRLDIDDNKTLAQRYNVDSIPRIMVLDAAGNPIKQRAGLSPNDPQDFLTWLAR